MLCNRGSTTSVNTASRTAAANHLRTKLQAASVHRMSGGVRQLGGLRPGGNAVCCALETDMI